MGIVTGTASSSAPMPPPLPQPGAPAAPQGPLGIDPDALAACVGCGLCLPHCPTYRVSGEESASPRGRIAAMRAVEWGGAPIDDAFVGFIDACVQCRGCESACPSGVPYGRLVERTRSVLADQRRITPWYQRAGLRVLGHHRMLVAGSSLLAVAQRVRLVPRRLGLPRLPIRQAPLAPSAQGPSPGEPVWLFTGCVMDAWQRATHRSALAVIEAAGGVVTLAPPAAACCGALHSHAGLTAQARRLAARVVDGFPGDAPILVDSAGCGAQLKDYGHLLGTQAGERFAARVLDVDEWLAARVERLGPPVRHLGAVAVADPCHLRHVQRAHQPVRALLAPFAELVELDDEGLCCGAGGAYASLHPQRAGEIRDRKLAAIARAGTTLVASANPGCLLHLEAAGVDARHPVDLVAEALGLASGPPRRAR